MADLTAEEFVQDRAAALKEVDKLRQSNIDKIKALNTYGATLDAALLANLKIDTFVESFLDEDAKLVYRRNLEMRLKGALDEGLAAARSHQLTQGVKPASNLILPT